MSSPLSFSRFLASPPGQQLSQWEAEHYALETQGAFGTDALQVGLPDLDCLAQCSIPRHWMCTSSEKHAMNVGEGRLPVVASPAQLPFGGESFELVCLPHTLDKTREPQQVLREAARVLCPEGRLIITVFNPMSLWWFRQKMVSLGARAYLPTQVSPIHPLRLKDWLGLLGFQIERGYWGHYTPSCYTQAAFSRWSWLNKAGDRWAPHCANFYMLSAVKRLPGIKLVGKIDAIKRGAAQLIQKPSRCPTP